MPPIGFTAVLSLNTVFNLVCLCASDEAQGYLHMNVHRVWRPEYIEHLSPFSTFIPLRQDFPLGIEVHTFSPNTQEVEAGQSLWIWVHPGLHSSRPARFIKWQLVSKKLERKRRREGEEKTGFLTEPKACNFWLLLTSPVSSRNMPVFTPQHWSYRHM